MDVGLFVCFNVIWFQCDYYFFFPLDLTFATGSHVGELIVWDALDWTKQASECNFWDSSVQPDTRTEIKLSQSPNETSVQHLASDEEVKILKLSKLLQVSVHDLTEKA